jgi:hypothetical protein
MHIEIVFGLALLLLTFWEFRRGETDTLILFDWWLWFDIDRESHPLIYWCIIGAQTAIGIGMVIQGLIKA